MQPFLQILPRHIIAALCGMIAHSLWQGLLMAVCVGVILLYTRNRSAAMRYNLLLASLSLFSISSLLTFVSVLMRLSVSPSVAAVTSNHSQYFKVGDFSSSIIKTPFIERLSMFIDAHATAIVGVWFVLVCVRSLQLALGLRHTFMLRSTQVATAGMYWQERVISLSSKMGITQMVRLLESGLAKVPMAIGYFKPVILMPAGMLAGLPLSELEAILIHELAHIRRKDYLINLLQSLLEIVFFFNPAVLWTSHLIRKEREHCCDDITIATAGSKVMYISALVSSQEYMQQVPSYAMAFSSKKKHLLSRVKRLAFNDRKPVTYAEKSMLAAGVLILGLLVAICAFGGRSKSKTVTVTNTVTIVNNDEKPRSKSNSDESVIKIYQPGDVGNGTAMKYGSQDRDAYLCKENGVLYQLFIKKGKVDVLYVNGKAVAADKMPRYNAVVNSLIVLYNNDTKAGEQREVPEVKPVTEKPEAPEEHALADAASTRPWAAPVSTGLVAMPVAANVNIPVSVKESITSATTSPSKSDRSKELIADLIRDGIIAQQGSNFSFKLSTSDFIVNGVMQSPEVYNKYKAKYLKVGRNDEVTWYYNYDAS